MISLCSGCFFSVMFQGGAGGGMAVSTFSVETLQVHQILHDLHHLLLPSREDTQKQAWG